jgi:hypothetical protein
MRFYAVRRGKALSLDAGGRAAWFIARTPVKTVAQARPLNRMSITTFRRRSISVRSDVGGTDLVALTLIRPGPKRHRFDPPPEVGHAPSRSFGAVFRYPTLLGAIAAWPIRRVLISQPVGGALGVRC